MSDQQQGHGGGAEAAETMDDGGEWEGGQEAEEMDDEVRQGNTVEIDIDSDDDVAAPDDDDADVEEDRELTDADIYSNAEDEPVEADDAVASVQHSDSVLSVAICPGDPRLFVTGGQDDVAVLWGLQDGKDGGVECTQRFRLEGHTDSVNQVAFSHDGQYVASASYDGTVRIWVAATGALLHVLEGPAKEVEWCIWHPKGHALLAGSADTMAWMWWAPTGKLMQIFAGHAQSVSCGCWATEGKLICTGSADCSVIVWNPRAGTPQQTVKQLHDGNIIAITAAPEAPIVVTGSEDATAKVVHAETGKVLSTLGGHSESVECIRFSNASSSGMLLLATGSMDGLVQVWDGKTFERRCALSEHTGHGGIVSFQWLPPPVYGLWLCTCSTDRTLRLFNGLAGQCMHLLRGHSDTILGLDVALVGQAAQDGSGQQLCVVSGSDDKSCRVFLVPLGATAASTAGGTSATAVAPATATSAAAGVGTAAPPPA